MGNYPDGVSVSSFYDYGESDRRHDQRLREELFIDCEEGGCGDSMYDSRRDYEVDRALDAMRGYE
ncbi:MAG: hypothetical protein IIZ12_05975 [Eggerthellaceae bacterium]|nr:hypothetical protein [Eggerthellaceae bacterium]